MPFGFQLLIGSEGHIYPLPKKFGFLLVFMHMMDQCPKIKNRNVMEVQCELGVSYKERHNWDLSLSLSLAKAHNYINCI